jgi:hypothetical protein
MSNNWIAYVYGEGNLSTPFRRTDFETQVNGQFQLLVSLCEISQKIVHDSLLQLGATDYIDAQLTSLILLTKRINTTIGEFQLKTSKLFLGTLDLIREMTGANMLMSIYGSSWKFNDFDISREVPMFLGKSIRNIRRLHRLSMPATIPIPTCRVPSCSTNIENQISKDDAEIQMKDNLTLIALCSFTFSQQKMGF